jgi:hypothetical protein
MPTTYVAQNGPTLNQETHIEVEDCGVFEFVVKVSDERFFPIGEPQSRDPPAQKNNRKSTPRTSSKCEKHQSTPAHRAPSGGFNGTGGAFARRCTGFWASPWPYATVPTQAPLSLQRVIALRLISTPNHRPYGPPHVALGPALSPTGEQLPFPSICAAPMPIALDPALLAAHHPSPLALCASPRSHNDPSHRRGIDLGHTRSRSQRSWPPQVVGGRCWPSSPSRAPRGASPKSRAVVADEHLAAEALAYRSTRCF